MIKRIKDLIQSSEGSGAFVVIVLIFLILGVFTIIWGALDIAYSSISGNVTASALNITLNESSPIYHDPSEGSGYVDMIWDSWLLILFIAAAIWGFAQTQTQQ